MHLCGVMHSDTQTQYISDVVKKKEKALRYRRPGEKRICIEKNWRNGRLLKDKESVDEKNGTDQIIGTITE